MDCAWRYSSICACVGSAMGAGTSTGLPTTLTIACLETREGLSFIPGLPTTLTIACRCGSTPGTEKPPDAPLLGPEKSGTWRDQRGPELHPAPHRARAERRAP